MNVNLKNIQEKLEKMGLHLPQAAGVAGNYVAAVRFGDVLHISGQISKTDDGSLFTGRLGEDLDVNQGQKAAQSCALQIIAQAFAAIDSDTSIARIIKLNGFVNSTPQFDQQPAVINGASDLMVDVFGSEIGSHARAAVGMASLPFNVAVEIDALIGLSSN